MIHWVHNALCAPGQHWLSACYQSVACSRDYWGLEREEREEKKKPRRCNKSPFTPSFVKLPPCAAPEGFSLRLTEDNSNSVRQLSRNNVRVVLHPRKQSTRIRIGFFFLSFLLIKLRWKRQSSRNARSAARQQPYFPLVGVLRVSIFLSQCRRNWDDSFYVIHFGNKRNVRGYSGYALRGRPPPSELTSPLCGLIPTLPPDRSYYSTGEELGQFQGVLLFLLYQRQGVRWARKMRSVSPRMRNMRGMGAGMKWTRWTELNGAGWEGLASPWIEWEMGGWVEKRERGSGGKGPGCAGCVQQQKKRSGAWILFSGGKEWSRWQKQAKQGKKKKKNIRPKTPQAMSDMSV